MLIRLITMLLYLYSIMHFGNNNGHLVYIIGISSCTWRRVINAAVAMRSDVGVKNDNVSTSSHQVPAQRNVENGETP